MAGPSVLAIVVAHASRTRVRETLRSINEQSYRDVGVVLCAIGALAVPEDVGISPHVVRIDEGAGFSEAVSAVIAEIGPTDAKYLLLLHDDVSLDPDAIREMVATADADPTVAAVGAKLVEWDNPQVLQEVGAAIDRFAIRRSALDAGEVDAGQRDDTTDVLFSSDACLLVRMDAFESVGGLDPKAWPFYEDVDLCWRLRAHGARVVVAPTARVRHAADLSRGRRLFETTGLQEHSERGRLRFLFKHFAPLGLAVLVPQLIVASIARVVAAAASRELWRARVVIGAWMSVLREVPAIRRERRIAGTGRVEDQELLTLAARGAMGDVRGERAEFASRAMAALGRIGERALVTAREPVTWGIVAGVIVVLLVLRNVLFGETFVLGELRPLAGVGDALSDHFARVRREGLDPFGPPAPALVGLGLLRSLLTRAALTEKVVLLASIWFAGVAGSRLARALSFGRTGRLLIATAAAVNPATLALIRDGSLGGLAMWTAALWFAGPLLAPPPEPEGRQELIRYVARWGFGWAFVVALHPPALIWLALFGAAIVAARRDDGRTRQRVRLMGTGMVGAFVLLLPWSIEWFTRRTPLIGRPGWLVQEIGGGLARATLGAGWPLLAWIVLAIAAAYFVGLTRTTATLSALAALSVAIATGGLMPRETMLAGAGAAAFVILVMAAKRIQDDLPSYELGSRHAAVIGGMVAIGALWLGGVVTTVPSAARESTSPVIAGVRARDTGRVLWMAETTGGIRTWTTLGFGERIGSFPPPGGPAERLVTRALEAARDGRTHRVGGVLALGDVSHIVALDAEARRGLGSQADLGPLEEQGTSVVYRNDAWRGPAVLLTAPPQDPFSPGGLADIVREPKRATVSGWPYGRPSVQMPTPQEGDEPIPDDAVLYVTGGPRGGLRFEGAQGHLTAAGAYVPASDVEGSVRLSVPGRWWRWLVPLNFAYVLILLFAWFFSAYVGRPAFTSAEVAPEAGSISLSRVGLVATPALLVLAAAIGWTGVAWGVSTPFLSSAWYCPPIGSGYKQRIAVVNPSDDRTEFLVRTDLSATPVEAGRIEGRHRRTFEIASQQGAVVESYGRRIAVASEVERSRNFDSSMCAQASRDQNAFPEGGRFATRAVPRLFERYVLFNPFPDLARASVRFVSPNETISPPDLQDVRVEAGKAVIVDPEDQFEPMLDLSTTVRIWQGRAIVARHLRTVDQVTWSLATDQITDGVLPRAITEDADTALIAVNLNDDPAHVSVSGAGRTGSLPEERFEVGPIGRSSFEINAIAPRAEELVVRVRSDLALFIESLVAPSDRKAVSLLGPQAPARRWVFPLAERRNLQLVNPNATPVRVDISRLGTGPPVRSVTIDPNRSISVGLGNEGTFGLLVQVRSGGGVTAAVVGERGTLPGVPLD